VGLHGTNEPNLIPGRPSHGCIRLPNNKVTQLWRRLPVGTPLHVI
jgi:lipoprotein-anchoring transpeptidase ErfK/SrfK